MKPMYLVAAVLPLLAACQGGQSQERYDYSEVGKSSVVEFATVAAVREVEVQGKSTGAGAAAGGIAGGIAGNDLGNGYGQVVGLAAGALVGALAGGATEQALSNYTALEYMVVKENGQAMTLVQNTAEGEPVFKPGDRVLVQMSGSYQRLLPTDRLPDSVDSPKPIELIE